MNLIPRDSFFDFDRLFNQFLSPAAPKEMAEGFFSPRVDITEHEDHYSITADLAGVEKDNIHVTLENGILKLEAAINTEKEDKKAGKVIRKERYSGSYVRSFNVGNGVTEADINATLNNGVLELSVPKVSETAPERRRINIQ